MAETAVADGGASRMDMKEASGISMRVTRPADGTLGRGNLETQAAIDLQRSWDDCRVETLASLAHG